jgi:hypothetical protein
LFLMLCPAGAFFLGIRKKNRIEKLFQVLALRDSA